MVARKDSEMMRSTRLVAVFLAATSLAPSLAAPVEPGADLPTGFRSPPDTAKPRVWWHWMNGNITKEGIKLDLEWMHRVGLGGFQTFDASRDTPRVVDKPLAFMTPEWKDAFHFAVDEAGKLDLTMGIAGSPGWSESGGPWVTPAQAMKKLVWSETSVDGSGHGPIRLPHPPTTTGPFQDAPYRADSAVGQAAEQAKPSFYADAAVVAYRARDAGPPAGQYSSSAGAINGGILSDGSFARSVAVPVGDAAHPAWIAIDLGSVRPVPAVALGMAQDNWAIPQSRKPAPPIGRIETSDDGAAWQAVAEMPGFNAEKISPPQHTIALSGVKARYVRIVLAPPPANADFRTAIFPPSAVDAKVHRVTEFRVEPEARIERFEEKAAWGTLPDYYADPTPDVGAGAIPHGDVIDLTARMRPDGTLDWTPPKGRWTILRFGYSLIGTLNHPASPEATGLEVDKLSKAHVDAYLDHYLGLYRDASGDRLGKGGVENVITDSWEAGVANWTDTMRADFAQRAGYDITPYLPVLAGRVVDSADASERFLYDFRRVIGDLVVDNHYGEIAKALHARGMRQYGESLERERPTIGDGMAIKHRADVPMGAFWTRRAPGEAMPNYGIDLRESASVAHVYGQNLVAAESLTANAATNGWIYSPRTLKPVADEMLALGVNQFVIHTSVHQPLVNKAPGLTLVVYGQHFNRNETWAEEAGPWVSYLARGSYMLQQGHTVADIAFFYGEEAPITELWADKTPTPAEVPEGYAFDFVNADALNTRLSVRDGRLVTPSGGDYALIYLGGSSRRMTLATAERLRTLARSGAVIVGARPQGSPSLADDAGKLDAVLDDMWGDTPQVRSVGRGTVYGNMTLAQALAAIGVQPDFDYSNPDNQAKLEYVHRRTDDGDIYYVTNRNARAEALTLSLRTSGHEAEIWHADTGREEPASYRIAGGRTTVPVSLDPDGTAFVVLRKPATAEARTVARPETMSSTPVDGPWTLAFQPDRGAPARATFPRLTSWSDNADAGIRYFSGTATYSKDIALPAGWTPGRELWLDLGDVREVAEVIVNGRTVDTLWKRPYRANIAPAVHPGRNHVEIRVTNLWPNRLIGDLQPGARKYSFTVFPVYRADSPLLPSGMLGPVSLDVVKPGAE
jgi:hypothetical protein